MDREDLLAAISLLDEVEIQLRVEEVSSVVIDKVVEARDQLLGLTELAEEWVALKDLEEDESET